MYFLSFMLCLLLTWIVLHFLFSTIQSKLRKLPPGPIPLPIFGNLFSLGSRPNISLARLAETYGPLMTLQLGQVPTVVISSAAVAKEVLQKNDLVFSHRMVADAVHALDHHKRSIVWLPVSHHWRNLRRICITKVFSNSRLDAGQTLRRNKVNDLVSYVKECCKTGVAVNIGQAGFTTSLNLLSSTFFSVDLGDPSSKIACELKEIVQGIMEEVGKSNFADYFPLLKKIDPQRIRHRTSVHFGRWIELFSTIIDQRLHERKSSGSVQGNDVLDFLLGIDQDKAEVLETSHIPSLLMDLFSAGTDTTSSTLEWAMAELIHNPEKLKKARAELEEIIGKGNPVEESNIASLPYLQAVVKETLRLHPAVPFLVPRKVKSDVVIFGCTVPKNAQVLVNACAIGRDPNIWENPHSFEPERFLGSEIDVKGRDFELIPFGSGRGICPGLPLAIRMLPLMLSSLIHDLIGSLKMGFHQKRWIWRRNLGLLCQKLSHFVQCRHAYEVMVSS